MPTGMGGNGVGTAKRFWLGLPIRNAREVSSARVWTLSRYFLGVVWSGRLKSATVGRGSKMGRIERAGRLGYNPGMKRDLDDLLKDALKLPPEARAALAGSLIDSLDATVDDNVEAAWDAEIARRLREIQEGQATLIPWSEVRRRLIGQ
jgi:putative addiction module component (TIGR02574 family)